LTGGALLDVEQFLQAPDSGIVRRDEKFHAELKRTGRVGKNVIEPDRMHRYVDFVCYAIFRDFQNKNARGVVVEGIEQMTGSGIDPGNGNAYSMDGDIVHPARDRFGNAMVAVRVAGQDDDLQRCFYPGRATQLLVHDVGTPFFRFFRCCGQGNIAPLTALKQYPSGHNRTMTMAYCPLAVMSNKKYRGLASAGNCSQGAADAAPCERARQFSCLSASSVRISLTSWPLGAVAMGLARTSSCQTRTAPSWSFRS